MAAIKTPQLLHAVLDEIREIRRDLDLLIPAERLEDYSHPARIRRSLKKALREFPIRRL